MTLLRQNSYRIIENLRKDGIDTHLVVLEADHQTVHDRILDRREKEGCWCMQNIDKCLEALQSYRHAVHIDTHEKFLEQIAEEILTKELF